MSYNKENDKPKIAIALDYDKGKDLAPKIVASGKRILADEIIKIAKKNNIHIHNDENLANMLSILELNSYIPIDAYNVVAEILSYIYNKDKQKK